MKDTNRVLQQQSTAADNGNIPISITDDGNGNGNGGTVETFPSTNHVNQNYELDRGGKETVVDNVQRRSLEYENNNEVKRRTSDIQNRNNASMTVTTATQGGTPGGRVEKRTRDGKMF